jgi:carboxymethylproline synthase
MTIVREERGSVRVVCFGRENPHNPVSRALERAIVAEMAAVRDDDAVRAVVLTGGAGRSFSVGGDFNEVGSMDTAEKVHRWIDGTIELYTSILAVDKPVVAAVDGYAIGIGFQLALACDWRVGTPGCTFLMWELQKGIACTLGGYMLEKCVGRLLMTEMIFGCGAVSSERALQISLLNEVADAGRLIDRAVERAQAFAAYPVVPFHRTKSAVNRSFIEGLASVAAHSKAVHAASFASGSHRAHFDKVLKTASRPANV